MDKKYKLLLSKIKRRALKHLWFTRLALVAALFLGALFCLWIVFLIVKQTRFGSYVEPAKNFIFAAKGEIRKDDNRTNILILGRGGEGHEAPDLTDTIIVLSASHTEPKATLISLPRDIWIESTKAKLNSSFHYGKIPLAKQTVQEVLGIPIHYAVVLDFSAFTKLIDALGGVEVDVATSFTDHKYPLAGKENDECGGDKTYACRYETISFDQGLHIMDGATALKFARSRNAQGDEGTDFARAARQQKVIDGVKNKILSTNLVFNPDKISEIVKLGEASVNTDISKEEGGVLARMGFEARDNIRHEVLGEPFLVHPPISARYQNQYVLIPAKNDWKEIQEWVKSVLP